MWARLSGRNSYNEPQARLFFWQNIQSAVEVAIQQYCDQAWKTIGRPGPGNLILHHYTQWEPLAILATFFSSGYDWQNACVTPIEFRIRMRRRKP